MKLTPKILFQSNLPVINAATGLSCALCLDLSPAHSSAQDAVALLGGEPYHYFPERFTWILMLSMVYLVNYKFYKWVANW